MDLRALPPIDAACFFTISFNVAESEMDRFFAKPLSSAFKIPDVDGLLNEEKFADVGIAYNDDGIYLYVKVNKPFEECQFPDFSKGDAFEVFLDTRGIENAVSFHKYCHHFVFLPKAEDGFMGYEISSFRGEEKHEISDPGTIRVKSHFLSKGYEMEIHIPEISLFGYSPKEVKKLFFAYRIHRKGGEPQHFPVSGIDYKMESHPLLWAKAIMGVKLV